FDRSMPPEPGRYHALPALHLVFNLSLMRRKCLPQPPKRGFIVVGTSDSTMMRCSIKETVLARNSRRSVQQRADVFGRKPSAGELRFLFSDLVRVSMGDNRVAEVP